MKSASRDPSCQTGIQQPITALTLAMQLLPQKAIVTVTEPKHSTREQHLGPVELFPSSLTVENVKGKITCSVSADKLEMKTEKGGERKKNWCIRRAPGLNYVTDQIYWLPRESTIDQLLPFFQHLRDVIITQQKGTILWSRPSM